MLGNPAPKTYVPDDNFEAYLETHDDNGDVVSVGDANSMGDGIANNDSVTTANISGVNNLDLTNNGSGFNIADLTGIEDFNSLNMLFCSSNQLSSLDISNNVNISYLLCSYNQLTSLDVSQNVNLINFQCKFNQLSSLDVSQNTVLHTLDCGHNQISNLNVSQNNLSFLHCNDNQLTTLDVIQNSNLYELNCSSNQLISLDVRNGNNTNFIAFNASGNSNLNCISVDDENYSTNNWTNIDAHTIFLDDCASFVALNADFSADATTVCQGFPVNFTDASTGSAGITSWSWDFGDGTTSDQTTYLQYRWNLRC